MMGWDNYTGWGYMGWGGWMAMAIGMVAFWGLVIFAVVAIFRRDGNGTPSNQRPGERNPQQLLDERFARGEIESDEYHARQEALRGEIR